MVTDYVVQGALAAGASASATQLALGVLRSMVAAQSASRTSPFPISSPPTSALNRCPSACSSHNATSAPFGVNSATNGTNHWLISSSSHIQSPSPPPPPADTAPENLLFWYASMQARLPRSNELYEYKILISFGSPLVPVIIKSYHFSTLVIKWLLEFDRPNVVLIDQTTTDTDSDHIIRYFIGLKVKSAKVQDFTLTVLSGNFNFN